MAMNIIIIASISIVVLTVLILLFTKNIGKSNNSIDKTYQYEVGKTVLEKEKVKCESLCKAGNSNLFFQEISSLKPYQKALDLNGLHCYDIIDDSKCTGNIKKTKTEIFEYYAN